MLGKRAVAYKEPGVVGLPALRAFPLDDTCTP